MFRVKPETDIESVATQVVDSYPIGVGCGAQATQKIKRMFNPFTTNCEAPVIQYPF